MLLSRVGGVDVKINFAALCVLNRPLLGLFAQLQHFKRWTFSSTDII